MESEYEAQAASEVEVVAEAFGAEEEVAPAELTQMFAPAASPAGVVPVKARIICTTGPGVQPLTVGKALVPGGSPLRMDVPGAGTLLLTATFKPPSALLPREQPAEPTAALEVLQSPTAPPPPAAGVKCLCRSNHRGGAEDQIKALATTLEQISSMQKLLAELQQKAQVLSDQLVASNQTPLPSPQPNMGFGGLPALPQTSPTQTPPFFTGRGPPGGKEVFCAPGLGIYVVHKDAAGAPSDCHPPAVMQPCTAPDTTPRDLKCSAPADMVQPRVGAGAVVCGGGGAVSCCGAPVCCGGVVCCGRHAALTCCGHTLPCCGGAAAKANDPCPELTCCQGDCTIACDSAGTCSGQAR